MEKPKNEMLPPAAYVNFFQVSQRQSEFFLAFGQMAQERGAAAHLLSSMVTSPIHLKSMLSALTDAVARYEARFGEIPSVTAAEPSTELGQRAGSAPPPVKRALSESKRQRGARESGA